LNRESKSIKSLDHLSLLKEKYQKANMSVLKPNNQNNGPSLGFLWENSFETNQFFIPSYNSFHNDRLKKLTLLVNRNI